MQQAHQEPNYMGVFYVLIVLTAAELWIANQNSMFGREKVIASLVILAFTKAALVALFYMHLKFEKWLLYGVCAMPIVLVCVLLSGTMPDVGRPSELVPLMGAPYPRTHPVPMGLAAASESKAP